MAKEQIPPRMETYAPGTVIVRERGVDQDAYIVLSGKVEVYKGDGASRAVLAELGPGQIFGEMAMVLERPRTASVRAVEETKVFRLDAETFARSLAADERTASVVRMIFERLRGMHADGGDAALSVRTHSTAGMKRMPVLSGATEEARACLAAGGAVKISTLPFLIGRRSEGLFAELLGHNDLYVDDAGPTLHVSRHHCAIGASPDGEAFFVQDRGSTLGTIVNGRAIGAVAASNQAPLDLASNELVLGNANSPFRFKISFRDTKA